MTDPCCVCGEPEDKTAEANGDYKRELRPYGPNGQPICYPCAISTPEMKKTVEENMAGYLQRAGPLPVLGDGPPRPATLSDLLHGKKP